MGPADESSAPALAPAAAWGWLCLPPESLLKQCRQSRFQGSGPGGQKRNRVYSGVRLIHGPTGLTAECVDSRASARNLGEALSRLRLAIALAAAPAPEPTGNAPVTQGGELSAATSRNAGVTDGPPAARVDGLEDSGLEGPGGPSHDGSAAAGGPHSIDPTSSGDHGSRDPDPFDPAPDHPFRADSNPSHPDYARGTLRALSLLRGHAGQVAPAAEALGCTPSALTRFLKAEKAVWARARAIRLGNGLHPLK